LGGFCKLQRFGKRNYTQILFGFVVNEAHFPRPDLSINAVFRGANTKKPLY
jgi:hypothetical protein